MAAVEGVVVENVEMLKLLKDLKEIQSTIKISIKVAIINSQTSPLLRMVTKTFSTLRKSQNRIQEQRTGSPL